MTWVMADMSGAASAWCETLWRATWEGSILIASVWLVCRAVPQLSPSVRCWLWWLACLRLVAALTPLPAIALPVLPAPRWIPPRPAETPAVTMPAVSSPPITPVVPPIAPNQGPDYMQELLLATWLAGSAFCLSSLLRQGKALRRLIRAARLIPESQAACEARRIGDEMGLSRRPIVLESPDITGPMISGFYRPVLLLPRTFSEGLSPRELRMAIAHELAHVRRRDLALAHLPALARVLFFYLPPAWLAVLEWSTAREAACDAEAIGATGAEPPEYGQLLIRLASHDHGPSIAPALGATAAYHTLKGRLTIIEHYRSIPGRAGRMAAAGLLAAAVLLIAPWHLSTRAAAASQAPKVSLNMQDAPLADVLQELFRQAGMNYRIATEVTGLGRVTVSMSEVSFKTALESVLRSTQTTSALTYRVENGVYVIAEGIPSRGMRQEERRASLSVANVDIQAAADSLGRALGAQIAVSPRVRGKVTVSFKDLSAQPALSRLVRAATSRTPLTYLMVPGGYLVLPMTDPRVQSRLVRRPVTVAFSAMDILYALKALFHQVGANYTIDQAANGTVTLSLRDVPFPAALERILKAGSTPLEWRWEDGIYLIEPRSQR